MAHQFQLIKNINYIKIAPVKGYIKYKVKYVYALKRQIVKTQFYFIQHTVFIYIIVSQKIYLLPLLYIR